MLDASRTGVAHFQKKAMACSKRHVHIFIMQSLIGVKRLGFMGVAGKYKLGAANES